MDIKIFHYAIQTGPVWTLVCVDLAANQCRVTTTADRFIDLVVGGTGERSIRRAAQDGAGRNYRTLEDLLADTVGTVTRRADLDC